MTTIKSRKATIGNPDGGALPRHLSSWVERSIHTGILFWWLEAAGIYPGVKI
jgi:hypothetical protein